MTFDPFENQGGAAAWDPAEAAASKKAADALFGTGDDSSESAPDDAVDAEATADDSLDDGTAEASVGPLNPS